MSSVATIDGYIASVPAERKVAFTKVRQLILDHLDPRFEEGIQYGMLGYYVPFSLYPKGYHANPKVPLPCFNLANQKGHMALYLMCIYAGGELETWFTQAWRATGKKLDMGKSCLRFKKLDDLALDVLVALFEKVTVERYVAAYELTRSQTPVKGRAQRGRS